MLSITNIRAIPGAVPPMPKTSVHELASVFDMIKKTEKFQSYFQGTADIDAIKGSMLECWASHGIPQSSLDTCIDMMMEKVPRPIQSPPHVFIKDAVVVMWRCHDIDYSRMVTDYYKSKMSPSLVHAMQIAEVKGDWTDADTHDAFRAGKKYIRNLDKCTHVCDEYNYNFARGFVGEFADNNNDAMLHGRMAADACYSSSLDWSTLRTCYEQMGRLFEGCERVKEQYRRHAKMCR
jgi:hypothetical protein